MKYLEKQLGDSADKHSAALEALKAAHLKQETAIDRHAKEFDGLRGAQAHHASMAERLDILERDLRDASERQAQAVKQELKTAYAKLDQMNTRLTAVQDAWRLSPRG